MTSLLTTIAIFGLGGAVLNVALQGLLLTLIGRSTKTGPRLAFGVAIALLLLVMPALAASRLLSTVPQAGFASAFTVALCVALIILGSTLVFSTITARRVSRDTTFPQLSGPTIYLGGLGICVLVGILGAVAALALV